MESNHKDRIVIIGFGWVGQANALAFLQDGYDISYYDIAEPTQHYAKDYVELYSQIRRLQDMRELDSLQTVYIVSVGDRYDSESGTQDIKALRSALEGLRGAEGTVVLRSTVVPTSLKDMPFDIYMPEFLHEKYAVEECRKPALSVLGIRDDAKAVPPLLEALEKKSEVIFRGSPEEASYIKYLSNLWAATRIAFTNEFGDAMRSRGHGTDRIESVLGIILKNKAYQRYGKAFGGHCLPKDTQAFIAEHKGHTPLIEGVWNSNEQHLKVQEGADLPTWFSKWGE